jgi:type I restriction enzyme S subunit
MVPNGWILKQLDEVCSKPISYGIVQTGQQITNGIACVRVVDLTKKEINTAEMITTTEEIHQSYKKTILEKDELMVALRGKIGLVRMVSEQLAGVNITRGIARLAPKLNIVDSGFLLWAVRSNQVKTDLMRMAGGSALQEISLTALRKVKIQVPPLPEQKKIAFILSTWDKAISTTEALIDNSKQQKKALMQQLLTGKKRLLDDSSKPFEGEWEELTVGNLGTIYSGGTPSTSNKEYWNGDIDWVTPTDITKQDSVYINSSVRQISPEGLKSSSAKLVPKGSLLVCTRATIGEMAITAHEMCTNQGFKNIVPNKKTNIEFVFNLLTYEKHKLISKASGSTFLELSKRTFEGMKFNVPMIDEQEKIAAVLTNADKEIELLQEQLIDLKQEKKALMQQLLTGKRRVKIDNIEAA